MNERCVVADAVGFAPSIHRGPSNGLCEPVWEGKGLRRAGRSACFDYGK